MSKVRKSVLGLVGAGALALSLLAAGSPAMAATGSGTTNCGLAKLGSVVKNSTRNGTGYYQNTVNGGGAGLPKNNFSYAGGYSANTTSQKSYWVVDNGPAGAWNTAPYATCV